MVNFHSGCVSQAANAWDADRAAETARLDSPPYSGLLIGQPDKAKAAMEAWERSHPRPVVTLAQVADHIEYIRDVAGVAHGEVVLRTK